MTLPTILLTLFFVFSSFSVSSGQTCSASDFVLSKDGVEFLKINSSNGLWSCDGLNICSELASAKQTLSLTNGVLSLSSNGGSVNLPNQLQSLSLVGQTLSLSGIQSSVSIAQFLSRANPPAARTVNRLDTSTGLLPSITIASDGNGLIAYSESNIPTFSLKVFHCADTACSTGTATTVLSQAYSYGPAAIAIGSDGLAVICAYQTDNADLIIVHCSDLACSNSTSNAVDTTGDVGQFASITVGGDGLALVAYMDATNSMLKIFHCNDILCSGGTATTLADTSGHISIMTGINGYAIVQFSSSSGTSLGNFYCVNADCSSFGVTFVATGGVGIGQISSVLGYDGFALVVFYDTTNTCLKAFHCTNIACTTTDGVNTITTSASNMGLSHSVTTGIDNLPLITYYDSAQQGIAVFHCANLACSKGNAAPVVNGGGKLWRTPSVTIGVDGLGLVALEDDTANALIVVHLGSVFGSDYIRRR